MIYMSLISSKNPKSDFLCVCKGGGGRGGGGGGGEGETVRGGGRVNLLDKDSKSDICWHGAGVWLVSEFF